MLLLYLLVSAMPLTRDPLWERFLSDLTAIKYLGLACLVAAFAHCALVRRAPALWHSAQSQCMQWFCLWAAVSWLCWGAPIAWDQSPLLSYLSFLALLVIVFGLVDTWPRFEHTLWAMVVAVAVASLYILREWQKYHNVYADFRPGWVTGDPNYFTASALIGLPLALMFSGCPGAWWKRAAARVCALITLLAIGLAASRGGMLGLATLLVYLAWRKRHLRWLALAVVLALPPLLLWSHSPLNRLLHPTASDNKSTDTRLALWQAGLRMVATHPLTGIGLGNFKPEVEVYAADHANLDHIAHNAYLEIAAEMGLPALAVFALAVVFSLRSLARVAKAAAPGGPAPPDEAPLDLFAPGPAAAPPAPAALPPPSNAPPAWMGAAALGLQAGLCGFCVSATFLSAQYTKLFWMAIALSAVAQTLAGAAPEAEVAEPGFALGWQPERSTQTSGEPSGVVWAGESAR